MLTESQIFWGSVDLIHASSRELLRLWNLVPRNIQEICVNLRQLQFDIREARRYLLENVNGISSLQLPAYYGFVTSTYLAVYQLGLTGCVAVVQGYVNEYVGYGLDRIVLIHLAASEGIMGLH